jgi:hypothetical protein
MRTRSSHSESLAVILKKIKTVKTRLITILLTTLFLASCKTEKEEKFKKLICGEWTIVKVEGKKKFSDNEVPPPLHNGKQNTGYIFYFNNICEDKRGYFKKTEGESHWDRITIYLGTKTKYKIVGDSLKIQNLVDNSWRCTKIRSITTDTLTLEENDTVLIKYVKANYKINEALTFDQIIVSSSECYGACPISDISIDKQGNVIFSGQSYTTKKGLFSAKINQSNYYTIERDFKKSDIDKLKEDYPGNWTDDQTITVTFIKNHKIYKTIRDYGNQSPSEFYWAYTPIRFMYQKLDLKPLTVNTKEEFSIRYIYFENKTEICSLTKSESFFLATELYKSIEVQHNFEKKYTIEYKDNDDRERKILTDGQYYQLELNGKKIIFDLGYNFLKRNNLYRKFKKKDH